MGGAAALWRTSGLTATVAHGRGVDPLTVAAWRMGLGTVALLVALSLRSDRGTDAEAVAIRALGHAERSRLVIVAVGLAAYQASYFLGVQRAGVTIATLVTLRLAPLLVTVGERLITRRRPGRRTVAGIGLALAGLAALVGAPTAAGPQVAAGAERLAAAAFVGAAALLVPLTATTAGLGIEGDVVVLGSLVYLGVVPTAVAYRLFFTGLPRIHDPGSRARPARTAGRNGAGAAVARRTAHPPRVGPAVMAGRRWRLRTAAWRSSCGSVCVPSSG